MKQESANQNCTPYTKNNYSRVIDIEIELSYRTKKKNNQNKQVRMGVKKTHPS